MSHTRRRAALLAALPLLLAGLAGAAVPALPADRPPAAAMAAGSAPAGETAAGSAPAGDAAATPPDTARAAAATNTAQAATNAARSAAAAPTRGTRAHPRRARATAAYDSDSALVRFRAGTGTAARRAAVVAGGARLGAAVGGSGLTRVHAAGDPAALVARLRRDPAVAGAALNYRRALRFVPNDARYAAYQAGNLGVLRLPTAWDTEAAAADQIIAVVDTGVDGTHEDLAGRLVAGCNTVGATPGCHGPTTDNSVSLDGGGHGTMVAGIIGAATNNGVGVAGVTSGAMIMPIRVFGPDPQDPTSLTATDDDVIEGVRWAVDHGATVVNLSLGGTEPGALEDAMTYARSHGVTVVAAAGNSGAPITEYPAAFPSVLAVAATDAAGRLTDFSTSGDWVDVAAPGFRVESTFPGDQYESWSGTSFSAPLVAGVAALARSVDGLGADEAFDRLVSTARDAGPRGFDPYYGYGLVDAAAAVGAAPAAELPQPDMVDDTDGFPGRPTAFAGASVHGTIGIEGDVDWYRRPVAAGSRVRLKLTPPGYSPSAAGNMDAVLLVYDQRLRLLAAVDDPFDVGAAEAVSLTAPAGTTALYVAVRSFNGARDTRAYTLAASTPAAGATPNAGAALWAREVSPAPYAVAQAPGVRPRVVFHRAMRAASVTGTTVRLVDARTGALIPRTVTYAAADRTATIAPAAPLTPHVPYRIEIGAVRDSAGAVYTGAATSTFRVGTVPVSAVTLAASTSAGTATAALTWANPAIGDLDRVVVRYAAGTAAPLTPGRGTLAYDSADPNAGSPTGVTLGGLTGPAHSFAIFAIDTAGRYSAPAVRRVHRADAALAATPAALPYGGRTTLRGSLRRAGALPLADAPVTLEFVRAATGAATAVAALRTDAAGRVAYRAAPPARGTYRIRYAGTVAGGTAVLPAAGSRGVEVAVAVSAALSRPAVALGSGTTLAGRVAPAHAGRPVRLQQLVAGTWRNVTERRLTAASGYAFALRPATRGTHTYRVYVPGDTAYAGGTSPVRALTVT
ncbi:S8 family serine peptidase [Pilimelia anulata]|uniref:S8 family serine peptidase n=1 Tax=Pilimelia anulata TaxID=53371 RepID=UPI00166ED447|nr:S8 family serine peptidase [Pilimelia anulata]